MAVSAIPLESHGFIAELDDLLYRVCDDLQLPPYRYRQAEERYRAVATFLEEEGSPFAAFAPRIYPQGSMRLGTTVRPLDGPHDLDFVLELSAPYQEVDPMKLIQGLFAVLKGNAVYHEMVELKNRCVRVTYENEFYMDILPACEDHLSGANCVQVPDRQVRSWKPSNPIGYAEWFQHRAELGPVLVFKAMPIPAQQRTEDKRPLQLIVQLVKRWRDIYYEGADGAPISIVLTTLASLQYGGEQSISEGLHTVLNGIVAMIAGAELQGGRVVVRNPSNPAEDLSERWEESPGAYRMFTLGIRQFAAEWDGILRRGGNVYAALERLFGETVNKVLLEKAGRLQDLRKAGLLAVTPTGRVTSTADAGTPIRPNTFHGD